MPIAREKELPYLCKVKTQRSEKTLLFRTMPLDGVEWIMMTNRPESKYGTICVNELSLEQIRNIVATLYYSFWKWGKKIPNKEIDFWQMITFMIGDSEAKSLNEFTMPVLYPNCSNEWVPLDGGTEYKQCLLEAKGKHIPSNCYKKGNKLLMVEPYIYQKIYGSKTPTIMACSLRNGQLFTKNVIQLRQYLHSALLFPSMKRFWVGIYSWGKKFYQFGREISIDMGNSDISPSRDLSFVWYNRSTETFQYGQPKEEAFRICQIPNVHSKYFHQGFILNTTKYIFPLARFVRWRCNLMDYVESFLPAVIQDGDIADFLLVLREISDEIMMIGYDDNPKFLVKIQSNGIIRDAIITKDGVIGASLEIPQPFFFLICMTSATKMDKSRGSSSWYGDY